MNRKSPQWLKDAIFYEIYPQSFYDSNGDGIGDIPGIIEKLDYIKSLGCNAIWINPCFESPFGDAGYDVSDYYKVAPRYGTNDDLKRLFEEAKKRGIKICLDLVPGHTSVEHPWFKESCKAEKNKYSNWYIWTNSAWESCEGFNTISGYAERNGKYVANFFYFQPALNYGFANPDPDKPWQLPVDHPDVLQVREEMKNVMRYWLDMGASGFRVDMAFSLIKNDPDKSANKALWNEIRDMLDREYPETVIISEWSNPVEAIPAGFHVDFLIHFGTPAYTSLFRKEKWRNNYPQPGRSFFDKDGEGNILEFLDVYMEQYNATKELGYISIPTGNHDIGRISAGRTQKELELVFAFILTMPGVSFIYYGDEIGMRYIEGLVSKEGGYDRTGSRTPMQWSSEKNAGFSSAEAEKLYLPVDNDYSTINVEVQDSDKNSLLNKVRRLTKLRSQHQALCADGDFIPLYAEKEKYPFIYMRKLGEEKFLIAINPSKNTVSVELDKENIGNSGDIVYGNGTNITFSIEKVKVEMEGISCGIVKIN
jgi:glycosidase